MMPSTFSPNKNYELQATGEHQGTWGVSLNAEALAVVDLNLGGRQAITINAANVTLTAEQQENVFITLTGTLTGNRDLIFTATAGGFFFIYNNTSGAFTVTAKPSGGTGVVCVQGKVMLVFISPTASSAFSLSPVFTDTSYTWTAQQTISLSGSQATPLELVSTNADSNAGPFLSLYRDDLSPVDGNPGPVINFYGKDSGGTKTAYAGITIYFDDITDTTEDGRMVFSVTTGGTEAQELALIGAALYPMTNDGLSLGLVNNAFADLFLASAGVINFGVNDVLITHSSNLLTVSGGDFYTAGSMFASLNMNIGVGAGTGTTSVWWGINSVKMIQMLNTAAAEVGSIVINAGGTVYNITSDARRKENVEEILDSGGIIDALRPVYFKWKGYDETSFGFIAQEVYAIPQVRDAVTKGDDDPLKKDDDEGFELWAMQKGALEAVLVAELKALRKRVEELEERLK